MSDFVFEIIAAPYSDSYLIPNRFKDDGQVASRVPVGVRLDRHNRLSAESLQAGHIERIVIGEHLLALSWGEMHLYQVEHWQRGSVLRSFRVRNVHEARDKLNELCRECTINMAEKALGIDILKPGLM